MSDLRSKLRKLAAEKPELRERLKPVLSMRTASAKKDLRWAADEIENALQMLEDVADMLDSDQGNQPSLADDYKAAAAAAQYLRLDLSIKLDQHQKALENLSR